jgi:hypothetical protein
MGVITVGAAGLYMLMYFPMWGGMFTKAKEGVSKEANYLAEWTPEERAQVCSWRHCYIVTFLVMSLQMPITPMRRITTWQNGRRRRGHKCVAGGAVTLLLSLLFLFRCP